MNKTIFIVEDEDILREIVKDYLLNEGYEVLEAADGHEALAIFELSSKLYCNGKE